MLRDAEVSEECIQFVSKLLTFDPKERISAADALLDPFFKRNIKVSEESTQATKNALKVIEGFHAGKRLQQAAIQYIVMNLSSDKEIMELELAFHTINVSLSGKISIDELIEAFEGQEEFQSLQKQIDQEDLNSWHEEVTRQFNEVDIDGSGYIEFTEWLVAAINKRTLITEEKLQLAFGLFDRDGGGSINAHEVRTTLIGDGTKLTP